MKKTLLTATLFATLPIAFGQGPKPLVGKDIAVPSARFPAEWYPKLNGTSTSAPIAGAPYSATWTMTTKVFDSEGKTVGVSLFRTLKWRDSAGRTRDEELFSEIPNAVSGMPNQITVADTVQHCQFTWAEPAVREEDREAVVNCLSLELGRTDDSPASKMTAPKPATVRERLGNITRTTTTTLLGNRTMQGLEAVGIHVIATDVDAEGTTHATTEGEIWWSPTMYEILSMTVKSRETLVSMEFSDIKMEEPDAGIFYPPEGYHIRKEAEVPPLPVPPQP